MDVLPAEAFRGAILRLLMLESGDFDVTPKLIRRSMMYSAMFEEAFNDLEASNAYTASASTASTRASFGDQYDDDGPWEALPVISSQVERPLYHPLTELAAGTMACYSGTGPKESSDLVTEWITRRNAISRGPECQKRPDASTRSMLWQLDARFIVPPEITSKSKSKSKSSIVTLQASRPISVLRVCDRSVSLIRLLGPVRAVSDGTIVYHGDTIAVDQQRPVLITTKHALGRAIKRNSLNAMLSSAASCGSALAKALVSDTSGDGACMHEWTNDRGSPSIFDTATALAPNATSIRSALLTIGFGNRIVRERSIGSDAELCAFIEANVLRLSPPNQPSSKKGNNGKKTTGGGGGGIYVSEREHVVGARKLLEALIATKGSKGSKGSKAMTWIADVKAAAQQSDEHGLEGWISGRHVCKEECIPASSMMSLSALVLAPCSQGIAINQYVRAPDWASFVALAKNSVAQRNDDDNEEVLVYDKENELVLQRWLAGIKQDVSSTDLGSDASRKLTSSERDWIIVDEVEGMQRVLSIADRPAYRSMMSPTSSAESMSSDRDVLLDLLGPSALSMTSAEAVKRAARILFETPPGGESVRNLGKVIEEIASKRDALFQRYKTTSIEARLVRRAQEEAEDSILVEKVQAIHGVLRATPAWSAVGRISADAFMARATQRLFRAMGVDPVRIPRVDAMNRVIAAYAKRAAADQGVAKTLAQVTEIRLDDAFLSQTAATNKRILASASSVSSQSRLPSYRLSIMRPRQTGQDAAAAAAAADDDNTAISVASPIMVSLYDDDEDDDDDGDVVETKPKPTPKLPSMFDLAVEATPENVGKVAASSEPNRKFIRDLLADKDSDHNRIVKTFLLADAIPFLYRTAKATVTATNKPATAALQRELARSGPQGRNHLSSSADALKAAVQASDAPDASASVIFFSTCIHLLSQHPTLTRMLVSEMIDQLRTRIEFNRTDSSAIKQEDEKITRLRSQQLF